MKPLIVVPTIVALMLGVVSAAEDSSEEKLLRNELDLAFYQATGLGQMHPTLVSLKKEIAKIEEQTPTIRNEEYFKLLVRNQQRLIDEDRWYEKSGYGTKHPLRAGVASKIKLIEAKLGEKENGSVERDPGE